MMVLETGLLQIALVAKEQYYKSPLFRIGEATDHE